MQVGLFVLGAQQRALHETQNSLLGGTIFIHGFTFAASKVQQDFGGLK